MNCHCQCNGKCKLLGGLEQQIMEVLWSSSDPLKPAQVQKQISTEYAYTTIMTVLKRMADKKLVSRRLKGNVYYYSATSNKSAFADTCLVDLFSRLFCSYGDNVIPSFKKAAKIAGLDI